jgi:uncharacterized membrane protein
MRKFEENIFDERAGAQRFKARIRFLVVTLLFFVVLGCSRRLTYPEPTQTAAEVIIDVALLETDIPQFYTYREEGGQINFFVVKTGGKTASFLDACEKCFTKKMGYKSSGFAVVCRACNERFPVESLEEGFGSCVPIKLESEIRNGKLYISRERLHGMIGTY